VEVEGTEFGDTFRLLAMRKLESSPLLSRLYLVVTPTPTKAGNPRSFIVVTKRGSALVHSQFRCFPFEKSFTAPSLPQAMMCVLSFQQANGSAFDV